MELENYDNRNLSGCGRPLKGCAVATAVAFAVIVFLLIYTARMPMVRDIMKCRMNMLDVGAALQRYHDVNGSYPTKLIDLKKDYLKDPSVLRCPLDKSSNRKTSYTYHRPKSDSPADFIILECCRHRFGTDMPEIRLLLHKDNNITLEKPSQQQK